MSPPAARPRRGWRAALVVLAALVAFLWAFVWVFDWNWLKPAIRHYIHERSGRDFEFDDLKVRLDSSLDPTLEFRNLTVQNAPWATSSAPLVRAGHVVAVYDWRSLLASVKVVKFVLLEDAQVDMERQANGIRNWRITAPDDVGPPRVKVIALQARRSTLRVVHRGIELDATGRIDALPAPHSLASHPDLPLTQRLRFEGTTHGHAFAVDTAVSDVLTFGLTPRTFALDGGATLGAWRIEARGVSNDVHALGDLDVEVEAAAAAKSSGTLWPLPEALAAVKPLAVKAHVAKTDVNWRASDVQASAGRRSVLAGEAGFTGAPHSDVRHALRATLRGVVIDMDDVDALAGRAPSSGSKPKPTTGLSTRPIAFARLRELDADVDLRDARIVAAAPHPLQGLRLHATLQDGALRVQGLDLGVADGHVTGTLAVDASRAPTQVSVELLARGLRAQALAPSLAKNGSLAGAVDGNASLASHGESTRALAQTASGQVDASLAPGASVSKRLDAKLSLDGGEWLRSLFSGSERVPVDCATIAVDVARGVATTRGLAFETEHTALAGHATLNLADAALDATLTPVRKQSALLALDRSIHASGTPGAIKVSLLPASAGVAPQRCRRATTPPVAAAASALSAR